MSISFDNLYAGETDPGFMFFIKDREVKNETKELYEYIKEHLE